MDNYTLIVITLPISLIFTLFFGVLAWTRKDRSMVYQSLGFMCSSLGSILLLMNAFIPQDVGLALFALLAVGAFQSFNRGFRSLFHISNPPLEQSILMTGLFLFTLVFLFIWHKHVNFAGVLAFYVILVLVDLLSVIFRKLKRFPRFIYLSFSTLVLVNILGCLLILALYAMEPKVESIGLTADILAFRLGLIFAIVDFGLWAIGILLIDHELLLERLKNNNSELREMALKDPLTGLNNRHFYDAIIHEEMSRSDRYEAPISMVLIDLDNFKRINDQWGHPMGDEVLRHIAHTIEHAIRSSDILLRFGGEEFLILMPETDVNGAIEASHKIRTTLLEDPHPVAGIISASFGVAQHQKSESQSHWYKRADQALYEAKAKGRNCVHGAKDAKITDLDDQRLEWQNSWASGHPTIDHQHKEMVMIGSKLLRLCEDGSKSGEVLIALDQLLNHVSTHFSYEEGILNKIGFPDLTQHQSIHRRLIQDALRYKNDFMQGQLDTAAFMSFILDEVILDHLIKTDYKFYPYLHALKE